MLPLGTCECSRAVNVVEWGIPGLILVLLPKCPLCIVAWIAVVTGIGISVSTAAYLRLGLLAICVGALVMLAIRLIRKWAV